MIRKFCRHRAVEVIALSAALTLVGCKSLTDTATLPGGYVDPNSYKTPAGAMGAYNGAVAQFHRGFLDAVRFSGLLSDELDGLGTSAEGFLVDTRDFGSYSGEHAGSDSYESLQRARSYAVQAIGALSKYAPDSSPSFRGRVYAFKGYAELLLADLYCSGVPLSDLEFEGDFVYKPSSSTREVYAHAITLFDSARALAGSNDSIANLALVGKGRALLALDSAAVAASVVAAVPDDFHYQFLVEWWYQAGSVENQVTFSPTSLGAVTSPVFSSVANRAGINGLPYRSSGDPRTAAMAMPEANAFGQTWVAYWPAKYGVLFQDPVNDIYLVNTSPITVASGVEARLIQAEAALKAGQPPTWLGILNALRTTGEWDATTDVYQCNVDRDPASGACSGDSTYVRTDTLWHPGTGGVAGLRQLADPGTTTARIDTMFAERAAWLFLTGQRQGDLRRLIRQYGKLQQQVYPTGTYQSLGVAPKTVVPSAYGNEVVLPIPPEETANPLFHGCIDKRA